MDNNFVRGFFAPGTGVGAVDLHEIDSYPPLYDCGHPYTWPTVRFPQNWQITHKQQSPTTPFAIAVFQAGTGSRCVNRSYGIPESLSGTPVFSTNPKTDFHVVRHADFTSTENNQYQLSVSTSTGNITIPQLGGHLSLNGPGSIIHVTDYNVGSVNMIYSSFSTAGEGETHEAAFPSHLSKPSVIEGHVTIKERQSTWVIQWQTTSSRCVIQIGPLQVHLLWRNEAYLYWVLELSAAESIGNISSLNKEKELVKAGYLIRHVEIADEELQLGGDVNSTTGVEVISTPVSRITAITFNETLSPSFKDVRRKTSSSDPPHTTTSRHPKSD
ncbi:hypothetical protein B7463_g9196, partial [Scytalidium lignicola]